jgi:hypothetical protein
MQTIPVGTRVVAAPKSIRLAKWRDMWPLYGTVTDTHENMAMVRVQSGYKLWYFTSELKVIPSKFRFHHQAP